MTTLPPDAATDLRRENARLQAELGTARDRETATSDILRVIKQSPTDVQPVFDVIVERAVRLCGGRMGRVYRYDDGMIHLVAGHGLSQPGLNTVQQVFPRPATDDTTAGRAIRSRRPYFVTDIEMDETVPALSRQMIGALGTRSQVTVPMLRSGEPIGAITVGWADPRAYGDQQVALLETFADQAVIAIENVRLFNETREALERQTATADILKVIASSPSKVQPVFEAIATSSNRLLGGFSTTVFRFIDGALHLMAFTPVNAAADQALKASFPSPVADFPLLELVHDGKVAHIADTEASLDLRLREIARSRGFRSMVFTPLISNGAPIGMIGVTRKEPGSFAAHHLQLLQTFADQAVIAIENVRLFDEVQARTNDLSEALQQQTATADVLKVISRSAFDLETVMNTLARSADELCDADLCGLFLKDGDFLALRGVSDIDPTVLNFLKDARVGIDDQSYMGRAMLYGTIANVPDFTKDTAPKVRTFQKAPGFNAMLIVPMMREGQGIGVFALCRSRVGAFSQRQIDLVQTFADQAVIAIENVRLFDEVQARTRDLTEALTYQTGSSNILKVIASSPTDVGPVLKAIVENACELCEADDAVVNLRDGDDLRYGAQHGTIPIGFERRAINRDWVTGRSVVDKVPIHLHDVLSAEGAEFPEAQEMSRRTGNRTILSVPLLRNDESIGAIILRRTEVKPFSEKQIALLQTFADQAVIAIGNVRLFDEVQARTNDLSEALQQQTATADVLKVISRSVFDLQSVLDTLVESACKLCGARLGLLYLRGDEAFECKAIAGAGVAEASLLFKGRPIRAGRGTAAERVIMTGEVQGITDFFADPDFDPAVGEVIRNAAGSSIGELRSTLAVPMTRDDAVVGVMVIARSQTGPFPPAQIELLQTFADQAVIAIENVRLFDEVQAKTRDLAESLQQQTATADVLKVISRSAFDLQAVFETLVESAAQLCRADRAAILRLHDNRLQMIATHGFSPEFRELMFARGVAVDRGSAVGRATLERRAVQIPDILADPEFTVFESQRVGGFRTVLGVPLLREGNPIGALFLTRGVVELFTQQQIDVVTTFADQAVIAIENARLFDEVQARTKELAASLNELRTAQDRLVQTEKLASLGQLTAGIAHEIKNPLNFVNNFAALSAELTDELSDVLRPAAFSDGIREEVDELTRMLKDNLEKIVQHGKRADSIVKNMLLHSREGSGEHRPADINALLDESLNLAYHGARAEKREFNITLQRDFDEMAGTIDLFPQEITRVFLNLIANGFYAVTKRKTDNGGPGFEPLLRATTRNLGDTVEIRIRDNGTGIPAEVREKMFNPFFTTKPAGEGTGLGLSMSHDIIVKQHGGSIDVETEPGQFTEFRIVLPRSSSLSNKHRGQT